MKAFILSIFFLAAGFATSAQSSNFTDAEMEELRSGVSGDYYITNTSRTVRGTPYLNDEWALGFAMISEKAKTENLFLRYHTEKNVVEFIRDDRIYAMDSGKIKGFTFLASPEDIEFKNGFRSEKFDITRSTLLRMVYSGQITLASHHYSRLKKDLPTYGNANRVDEYEYYTRYYLIRPDGNFIQTGLSREEILNALDEGYRERILRFAGEKNLGFTDESDLVEILTFYDRISK